MVEKSNVNNRVTLGQLINFKSNKIEIVNDDFLLKYGKIKSDDMILLEQMKWGGKWGNDLILFTEKEFESFKEYLEHCIFNINYINYLYFDLFTGRRIEDQSFKEYTNRCTSNINYINNNSYYSQQISDSFKQGQHNCQFGNNILAKFYYNAFYQRLEIISPIGHICMFQDSIIALNSLVSNLQKLLDQLMFEEL